MSRSFTHELPIALRKRQDFGDFRPTEMTDNWETSITALRPIRTVSQSPVAALWAASHANAHWPLLSTLRYHQSRKERKLIPLRVMILAVSIALGDLRWPIN